MTGCVWQVQGHMQGLLFLFNLIRALAPVVCGAAWVRLWPAQCRVSELNFGEIQLLIIFAAAASQLRARPRNAARADCDLRLSTPTSVLRPRQHWP